MFQIVIPVLNQHDEAVKYLDSWFSLAKGKLWVLIIDNGSDEPFSERQELKEWVKDHTVIVVRNDKNVGVYPTFQQGFSLTASHWIFYSHSDVEMLEFGWDEKLRDILRDLAAMGCGACGMFGAKGLGKPEINKKPYDFTQLMRWDCITVPSMAGKEHTFFTGRQIKFLYERVMVLDGFSMILNREMIWHAMNGKFDHERFPVHHCYDQDICLESHFGGWRNYVIDIDCIHHGGMTSTREQWAEKMGTTDLKTHRDAHKVMYDKWRHDLPVSVM